ncbi:MAG TPA: glycoside hydrolase family 15 protein [Ktedonobacterales bacterium]
MPRDLPIANGRTLANFDANYNLRDIYWPHIGQQNQTLGHVSHSGVWVDGAFSWFDSDDWSRDLRYQPESLTTAVTLTSERLALRIDCADTIDFDRDILLRRMLVTNQADHAREVRLFFHHDWHLWENAGSNTVYYRPDHNFLVAYKRHCYILVDGIVGGDLAGAPAAKRQGEVGVYQWAIGKKEFDGQEGTWRDAEDGELGGNPIAQGSVDSCAGFHLGEVAPGATQRCYHWLAFGRTYEQVHALDDLVRQRGPESFLHRTSDYWRVWVNTKPLGESDLEQPLVDLYKRSLLIVRAETDVHGAIIAATDADVYSFSADSYAYMWPRDGAIVANALSHAGYGDITGAFFHFCRKVITRQGYLLHKYTPSGALGSSWHPWMNADGALELPIQEDETALVLSALWQHFELFHEVEFVRPLYRPLVIVAADFMADFREPMTKLPAPSWDLWEERHGIHAYTVAAVYDGLTAAANFADLFGEHHHADRYRTAAQEIKAAARQYLWHEGERRFLRMIRVTPTGAIEPDMTMDSSVAGIFKMGMFAAASDEMSSTMDAYQQRLSIHTSVGGIARYENDYYHQVTHNLSQATGNPWFITALWLAQYHIARAATLDDLAQAKPWLTWTQEHALPSGVLAEQIDPLTHAPLSVSPLTWSHAEYVATMRWYVKKYESLVTQSPNPHGMRPVGP